MKIYKFILFVLLCITHFSLNSCSKDDDCPDVTKKNKTIICYMAAENSLSYLLREDINEIISCAKYLKDGDHIVIFYDGISFPSIYVIDNKTTAYSLNSLDPVVSYGSDFNSCSKAAMKAFFYYVMNNYPADSYGLVFSSHGSSWLPPIDYMSNNSTSRKRSFGVDNGKNSFSDNGAEMRIVDLEESIKVLPKLDFILFDLCYMQSIEVVYQMRDCADYIIGSPAEIPGNGAPFQLVMPELLNDDIDYRKVIELYADYYHEWQEGKTDCGLALSVVKTEYLDSLKNVTNKMTSKYGNKIKECRYNETTNYYGVYYSYLKYQTGFYDMREMLCNMMDEAEFKEWDSVYKKTVPYYFVAPYIYSNATSGELGSQYVKTNPEKCGGMAMSLHPSETTLEEIISEYESLDWNY